jgi:hypothetical protein
MAYSSTNPPRLVAQPIAGARHWAYDSTDPSTTVDDTDYFSDGYQRGMRVGDRLTATVSSSYNQSIGIVSVASSSGPCTVVFGGLVST